MMLSPRDFSTFFEEVYGHEPFPWQERLLEQVAEKGEWPKVLDLPTGSGKTATIDIAVFHLALEADRQEARKAPARIAFVVDRRLVVDDAFTRAKALAEALATPRGTVTAQVAERLKALSDEPLHSEDCRPLIARRLRGGIPREDDWARTPAQPTILCSTVDQIGSRLLFRGYGVSDSMKPVHAGLIGADCLILLDEAHLAEPFRQTLQWVQRYRRQDWREAKELAPWGVALLTATPGEKSPGGFALDDKDRKHPVLKKRLSAVKPARLIGPAKLKAKTDGVPDTEDEETDGNERDHVRRASEIVDEIRRALAHFEPPANGAPAPAIGVVVNRVARARAVFDCLKKEINSKIDAGAIAMPILMIGPARPVDRDELAGVLEPIRTRTWKEGEKRTLDKPLLLVATQCIEAGVDIDLDGLITEAAPLDALRQRFGRLNRAGRDIIPYSAVLATKKEVSARHDDPVYGQAIKFAWDCLLEGAMKEGNELIVDFGLNAFAVPIRREALSPKPDAPVLMPAHVDLLSHTSPIPDADPEVALYLHGPNRQPDSITVVWRADIDPGRNRDADVRRLLMLAQPRASEAIQLPLWAVRHWLEHARTPDLLADAAAMAPEEERTRAGEPARRVFRWKGDDDRSRWMAPRDLRAGDAVVVPASYGGVDQFGWNPGSRESASDVARKAALPFKGRRFTVRVAPGLVGESVTDEALADALAGAESRSWQDVRAALLDLPLTAEVRDDLALLDDANRRRVAPPYLDVYGTTGDRPRGVVFVAPFGIKDARDDEEGSPNATEGDTSGALLGLSLTLVQHSADVERKAELFARAAGLPETRVRDLKLAGFLHDAGKADPRFQSWLHYGDPLGPDLDDADAVLAKSGRPLPPTARADSGLPKNWRHEAFSVRLAPHIGRFAEAEDPELVLWLVGAHHGYGRPLFPHCDPDDDKARRLPAVSGFPAEMPPGPGPQSLAFDWNGLDWPGLFGRLRARYGVWGLAHMEAILRLADHRASEDAKGQGK